MAAQVSRQESGRGRGLLLSVLGLAAVVAALWFATGFLKAEDAAEGILSGFYRLIGLGDQADLIDTYGLSPVANKLIIAMVALVVGIAGIWALFIATNRIVDHLGHVWVHRVRPWVFLVPALALVGFYLVFPTIRTIMLSVTDRPEGTGLLDNYRHAFTDPTMLLAMRNNVLWLVLGTGGAVIIGLAFATLVDRVKREALAKTFVFLPLAISMVGAAVVWRFVYYWRPAGQPQIGLLNAVLTAAGNEPVAILQTPPVNTLALIVIMVWLQVGFVMVVLSSAIKGVPTEIIEAARIDGAGEWQVFRRVVIPTIRGSVITVATTVFIAILKVFDIVFVTTGGRFETDVVANRMFTEMIRFRNFGKASALAVILFVAVVPIMVVNIRNLRKQGIGV